ncbi:MAG: DUF4197 domain-containing protein [Chlorobi bacterium]|nr:DUF4197 domain-containing protein [Chlorobiota bacterium]
MKQKFILFLFPLLVTSCEVLQQLEIPVSTPLSDHEIADGLKEALKVGTRNAVANLNKTNGFFLDQAVKIPFPEDVKVIEEKLRSLGLNKPVDDFIEQMNHAAEKAVTKAAPIFYQAILDMTFTDARNILKGPDNAATEYFKNKTYDQLVMTFKPDIYQVMNQMNLVDTWQKLADTYNRLPLTRDVETDLAQYVTEKTIQGLFYKVEQEEKRIRTDPAARVTEILRRVFGSSV